MLPQEMIRAKRDGAALSDAEIAFVVEGITSGTMAESQIGAFAMAVCLRGMDSAETTALTNAMTRSGRVLDWRDLSGPVLDKHSTGGIGDSVSLMLAPALAACGAFVPMISGRGLGHTGGTLDKLESIPGYQTQPDRELFRTTVASVGCAIIGQTADLAPADKRLYAIRDVTATVESIPLITSSILSKKFAAGLDGLVMNVTVGSGAFMENIDDGRALARSIVDVARLAGVPTTAIISDMNEPLADVAGNALEVAYAIDYLSGRRRQPRMDELVVELGAELLVIGSLARSPDEARSAVRRAIESGAALDRFDRMVATLGGPIDFSCRATDLLPKAPIVRAVFARRPGYITGVNTRQVGLGVVALGGGRTREDQAIDHGVGFTDLAGVGEEVGTDRPLAVVHARDENGLAGAVDRILTAYAIGDERPAGSPVILERVAAIGRRDLIRGES